MARSTKYAAIPALMTLLLLVGCHTGNRHSHFENHPKAVASPFKFVWGGDLIHYDAFDQYIWDTNWDEVFIEFSAYDFIGEFCVEIYDGVGDLVFADTYFGVGGDLFVSTQTKLGYSGNWVIEINSFDLTGDVQLTLD